MTSAVSCHYIRLVIVNIRNGSNMLESGLDWYVILLAEVNLAFCSYVYCCTSKSIPKSLFAFLVVMVARSSAFRACV